MCRYNVIQIFFINSDFISKRNNRKSKHTSISFDYSIPKFYYNIHNIIYVNGIKIFANLIKKIKNKKMQTNKNIPALKAPATL